MPTKINGRYSLNLNTLNKTIQFVFLATGLSLISCDNSKYEKLLAENDSLKHQINSGGQMVTALVRVNTLLDSIDATRHVMRVNQADGLMEPASYAKRLVELKNYIAQTEEKIGELEATLVDTNVNSESYRAANVYLDRKAPWKVFNDNPVAAGTSIYVTLRVIDNLKILFGPFLPFTCQQLHEYLGYEGQLFGQQYTQSFTEQLREHVGLCYDNRQAEGRWEVSRLSPGQALRKPAPLFKKLEPEVAEEELARLI
jgi:methionyl-tRNA synthetase